MSACVCVCVRVYACTYVYVCMSSCDPTFMDFVSICMYVIRRFHIVQYISCVGCVSLACTA